MDEMDFDQCYRAVESRDPRFDGWFIVAVRTTGIYCRPSCPTPVRPKAVNVTFFKSAAAAQLAGYRACKRCRPDAIPGSPEWDARCDLAGRAMRLIADGVVDRDGVAGLARRLAISERHLHRSLVDAVGAPPLALARAQRAQTARILIETTQLPFAEIAFAAGFPSIRQFNETVQQVFCATPTHLRSAWRGESQSGAGRLTVRLAVRRPYDGASALAWLARRQVAGVEELAGGSYRRTLPLPGGPGTVELTPGDGNVSASFQLATIADLQSAVARSRRLLDLDADPAAFGPSLAADPALAPQVRAHPGLRLHGSVDAVETAIRVVLGQHISVKAARTIAGRMVSAYGKPLDIADGGLTHQFPAPQALADAPLEELGLPARRAAALRELTRQLADGALVLDPGADRSDVRARLLAIPGIGPWTADLIALRALGDPDAFPAADLGLLRSARALGLPGTATSLHRYADRWRPWRSYAAHYLWEAL